MPKHPDFEKILAQFIKRYGKERGERFYYAWLNKMKLDDTKPYGSQKEAFRWATPHLMQMKEDEDFLYWKAEVAFPVSSMNRNVYTEDELKAAVRTLIGKPVNMNHDTTIQHEAEIVDAEYEDGAAEVLLKIPKVSPMNAQIRDGMGDSPGPTAIIHSSLEGSCLRGMEDHPEGKKCCGLVFDGLALLTKEVLPGIPLTRFYAAESFIDEFEGLVEEIFHPIIDNTVMVDKPQWRALVVDTTTNLTQRPETPISPGPSDSPMEAPPTSKPGDTKPLQPEPASQTPPAAHPPQADSAAAATSPPAPAAAPVASPGAAPDAPSAPAQPIPNSPEPAKVEPAHATPQDATPPGGGETPKDGASGTGSGEAPKEPDAPKQPMKGEPMTPSTAMPGTSAIPEPTDDIYTEDGLRKRFDLYHKTHGLSRQDSYRLVMLDIFNHARKGRK